jgi:hypothetical protein
MADVRGAGSLIRDVRPLAHMKLFAPLFLTLCLLTTSGCISAHVVNNMAKAHVEYDDKKKESVDVAAQPAYYALLPLTIPADIVASPFYLYCYIAFMITGDGP